jgi:hypothetical protein
MEKFYPTFSEAIINQLEKCAEVVGVKTPAELAEFDSMHTTIKEVAEKTLAEGNISQINHIMSVMNTFKAIYTKAHEQKNAHDARLQERRNALKNLIAEF